MDQRIRDRRGRSGGHRCNGPLGSKDRGIAGFYEAIMAMMVVTMGVVLLTASLALASVDERGDLGNRARCDELVDLLMNDPSVARSTRLLDKRSIERFDIGSHVANWTVGYKVMLTFVHGDTVVLFDSGTEAGAARHSRSEAVNVICGQADVRPALLTVWVWK